MSMRLMIFAFGVLLLVGFVGAAIPGDCDDDMVAYWQMEGNAEDSFGSHDGSGFPTTGSLINGAASFDGSQMISISDTDQVLDLHEDSGFTIEFWMKPEDVSLTSYLLDKDNYNIRFIREGSSPSIIRYIEATINGVTISSLPGLSLVEGHHVVLTWQSAAQNLSLYIDNQFEASGTLVNPGVSLDALEIGDGFVGLIDEVAFYDRSFDEDDVNLHWLISGSGRDYCYPGGAGNISTTRTDFTLAGCILPDGSSISAGTCSRNGMYYCGNVSLILYDTLGISPFLPSNRGCSLEQIEYEPGAPQCCPSGYLCGDDLDTDETELVCNLRSEECESFTGEDVCSKAGCFWLVDEGVCVDNPLDYSCSIYKSETSCELDIWNVGRAGMGTEVCGTYFIVNQQGYVVPMDSCKCDWTTLGIDSGECVLGYDIVPDVYGTLANTFRCHKDFDAGACIDGLQKITWEAGATNVVGWDISSAEFLEVLETAGCVTNADGIMRSCGEPIVKLPGFSLFALISSLGIIGLVYIFRKE